MSSAEQNRMALLTFVTVSVATLFGVFLGAVIFGSFRGDGDEAPVAVGLIVIPLPALAAALAFLFVARFETGRKTVGRPVGVFRHVGRDVGLCWAWSSWSGACCHRQRRVWRPRSTAP